MGYKINDKGVHDKRENLEAILDAETPTGVPELRSFLGLVTYYQKFLPQAATILAPLYELLRAKMEWKWGVAQQQAFEEVKALIRKAEFLAHYDPDKLYVTLQQSALEPFFLMAQLRG